MSAFRKALDELEAEDKRPSDATSHGFWARRSIDLVQRQGQPSECQPAVASRDAPSREEEEEDAPKAEEILEAARRSFTSKAYYTKALACFRRAAHFKNERRERKVLALPQLHRCQRLLESSLFELPENRPAHFLLTAVLMQLGSFEAAKREATSLLQSLSVLTRWKELRDPVLHQAIAHASWRVGQDGDAMSHLLDATTDFPDHPQLCLNLSEMLLAAKCHTSAKDMAQLALLRNHSDWVRSRLSDAEEERATCCLKMAVGELGSSLQDAIAKSPTLKLKVMSDKEMQKRCSALLTRLQMRGKASGMPTSLPEEIGPRAKDFPARDVLRQVNRSADFQSILPSRDKDGVLQAKANQGGSDSPDGSYALLREGVVTPATSDPTLRRLKWTSPPKPAPAWATSSGPEGESRTPSSASAKPMMGELDLMMGLLPLERPKEKQKHAVGPHLESAISPQFGLWCCISECKQQCRR